MGRVIVMMVNFAGMSPRGRIVAIESKGIVML